MNNCEFCHNDFHSRPQVKRPRACPSCQKERQRSNEKDWRILNPQYFSALYHKLMREERMRKLKVAAKLLSKCIGVGKEMLGMTLAVDDLGAIFWKLLVELGIRRVNKFWGAEIII